YQISAIIEFNCFTDTIMQSITLLECPDSLNPTLPFEFPNVITPNSDGTNDFFAIENLPENTEVIIVNRLGNVVFSSENYQNTWDGKDTSGKELIEGVYTYKFKTESGKIGHGFVHLLR
ncbi:MAG: gliding motility-associated C-terminal domain-containing protein, partial [Sphingomonadales bacterium]